MKSLIFMIALLLPAAASANQRAATACASRLNPQASLVYNATAPAIHSGPPLRDLIKAKTTGLVRSGRLDRHSARPAAMAAYKCLRRLH